MCAKIIMRTRLSIWPCENNMTVSYIHMICEGPLKPSQEAYSLQLRNQSWIGGAIRSITTLYTTMVEKKPLLSLLYTNSSSRSKEDEMISKYYHNFWTKRIQRIPHVSFVKITKRSLMVPCFKPLNKVWAAKVVTDGHTEQLS